MPKISISGQIVCEIVACSVAFSLLNARSDKNKRLLIKDWVVDNNIDLLALTETWLQPDNKDDHNIGELTPTGYSFYHSPAN